MDPEQAIKDFASRIRNAEKHLEKGERESAAWEMTNASFVYDGLLGWRGFQPKNASELPGLVKRYDALREELGEYDIS